MDRKYIPLGLLGLALTVGLVGCRSPHVARSHEYATTRSVVGASNAGNVDRKSITNPVVQELAGPHDVDEYVRVALLQNPRVQAARLLVESKIARVPQAASLVDPTLNVMGWP